VAGRATEQGPSLTLRVSAFFGRVLSDSDLLSHQTALRVALGPATYALNWWVPSGMLLVSQTVPTIMSAQFSHASKRPRAKASRTSAESLSDHIGHNIETVVTLQKREWEATSPSQRRLERVSRFVGRPLYLVGIAWFIAVWIMVNSGAAYLGYRPMDAAPFPWLQGLLTAVALLTTTVVLISQNRQTRLEQGRSHLDLQVNLLTEQKVTKIIHLLEELRHDMPMVKDRHDPKATTLQEGADTEQMVAAILEVGLTDTPDTAAD
jgi:uncharacterized membrane protein